MSQSAARPLPEPAPPNLTLVPPLLEPDEAEHVHTIECSPLFGGTQLAGRIVTDPDEIAAIRRRIEAHTESRGAWRRVLRRIRAGR